MIRLRILAARASLWFVLTLLTALPVSAQEPEVEIAGKPIRSIAFEGKFKLRRYILHRELTVAVGDSLDLESLDHDRRRIESFGIFSKVEPRLETDGDSVDVIFNLREVWTLLPLVAIGSTDEKLDWSLGVAERNLLGFYVQSAVLFRRYEGKNSGFFSITAPRAFGKDLSLSLALSDQREIEPLSTHGLRADYDYQHKAISAAVGRRLHEQIYSYISGGYDRENWTWRDQPVDRTHFPTTIDYPRYVVGTGVVLGRVYYDHYFYTGVDLSNDLALINERPAGRFEKWRYSISARGYQIVGPVNLAGRIAMRTSSADERVQPYSVSGEANVRGYSDKIERGDRLLTGNFEVRFEFWDRKLFYGQLAAFADYGAIWGRGRSASDAFAEPYWSIGAGLRGAIQQFLGRIGRLDVALNPRTGEVRYYLSTAQFF